MNRGGKPQSLALTLIMEGYHVAKEILLNE